MNPLDIGRMRFRVNIQSSSDSNNTFGEPVESFSTVTNGTVWASIEPISSREFFASQQVSSDVTHRIVIRYLAGVTAKMQVVYGSRTFDIEAVRNIEERGRMLELMCKERYT